MLYPIYCAHMLSQSDRGISFRTLSGKIYTFKSNMTLILALLQKSTGTVSADEIARVVAKEIGVPENTVVDAIDDLVLCGILVDSHEQFLMYHNLSYNPPKYPPVLSLSEVRELTETRPDYITPNPAAVYKDTNALSLPIYSALHERNSCRDFLDVPIEAEKLFAICKVSYSSQLRPVASAGALFPLSVYFINRVSSKQLPAGLYQYDPMKEEILLLPVKLFSEAVQYSLNDSDNIFGAPCIFFICADISRHVKKYADRGYRYTLLEAGHAVQNMTIAVAELGLGGVEYGGFCDEAVKGLFQMPEAVFPLACYAVGYKDVNGKRAESSLQKEREKHIIEKIACNKELGINPYLIEDERFKLSNLQVVVSEFKDACGQVDFGTGAAPSYSSAYVRSIMEVYERYALSHRYFDRLECANKLDQKYLDPQEYVPYSDAQLARNGFARFCKEDLAEWLRGYDINGDCVYVPADLCFDVFRQGRIPYHMANTSGCAAHFDIHVAEKMALLELIERDAIIRNWIYRQTPYRLKREELSDNIKHRLQRYLENGTFIYVLSLPCEYAFTVLVCSVSDAGPPYFVSGAAASFSSVTEAAAKAFDEWEISFVLGGAAENSDIVTPEEVVSPKDHGDLYRYANHNREIDYLLHGQQISVSEVHANQLENVHELSPVFFAYRPFIENAYVVRAFSRELIPINFGYGMVFLDHSKVDRRLLRDNGFPHFFA